MFSYIEIAVGLFFLVHAIRGTKPYPTIIWTTPEPRTPTRTIDRAWYGILAAGFIAFGALQLLKLL